MNPDRITWSELVTYAVILLTLILGAQTAWPATGYKASQHRTCYYQSEHNRVKASTWGRPEVDLKPYTVDRVIRRYGFDRPGVTIIGDHPPAHLCGAGDHGEDYFVLRNACLAGYPGMGGDCLPTAQERLDLNAWGQYGDEARLRQWTADHQDTPPPPARECGDGIDNDRDGCTDMADPACKHPGWYSESPKQSTCRAVEPPPPPPDPKACANGLDDDGDGLVDMADPGCEGTEDDDETNAVGPPPPPPVGEVCTEWTIRVFTPRVESTGRSRMVVVGEPRECP